MKITNFPLIILALLAIFFISGCSRSSINDYTTLKQKALEIPPDFELTPPKDKKDKSEIKSDETLEEFDNGTYDIESLLSKSLQNPDENLNENDKTEQDNASQYPDDQQMSIEDFITDQIENIDNKQKINEEAAVVNDDNEFYDLVDENQSSEIAEQDSNESNLSSEDKFLEDLSDVEEIITLPEDEQLQSQRSTGSNYESDEFLSSEDLNDLLDRVDSLFEDQLSGD